MELNLMETDKPTEDEQETSLFLISDWDNRILCSDGNCIGVIGPGRQLQRVRQKI